MHWDPTERYCLDESSIATAHRLQECSLFRDDALAELLSRYPRTDIRVTTMGGTLAHPNELQDGNLGDLSGAELLYRIRFGRLRLQLLRLGAKRDALASLTRNLGREVDECLNSSFEMENATLTNIEGYQADDPDLTLVINRSDLEMTMMGSVELEQQIADGIATIEGDPGVLAQLASTMVDFDPLFEILPGTAKAHEVAQSNAYEAVPGATIPE